MTSAKDDFGVIADLNEGKECEEYLDNIAERLDDLFVSYEYGDVFDDLILETHQVFMDAFHIADYTSAQRAIALFNIIFDSIEEEESLEDSDLDQLDSNALFMDIDKISMICLEQIDSIMHCFYGADGNRIGRHGLEKRFKTEPYQNLKKEFFSLLENIAKLNPAIGMDVLES
jgi:hypothetical protein